MSNYNVFSTGQGIISNIGESNSTIFGDVRCGQFSPQTGWRFNYTINTDLVTTSVINGATITKLSTSPIALLQTGTSTGASAQLTSKTNLIYVPGIGIRMNFTCSFSTPVSGTTQLIGFGDNNDGLFFGFNGTTFGILKRSSTSGSPVDTWIPQSNWNIDTMDGNGPSQLTLNPFLATVYQIKSQWLGYGLIAFYIENPYTGAFTPVHKIYYADTNLLTHISTPNLPCIAQVKNNSSGSNIQLQTACSILGLEGISDFPLSTMNSALGTNITIATTIVQVLAIQNNTLVNSIINRTPVQVQLLSASSIPANANTRSTFYIYRNKTVSGALTNVDDALSVMSYSSGIVALGTGGSTIISFQLTGTSQQTLDLQPYNIVLNPTDSLVIGCECSAGTSNDASVSLNWKEFF